MTDRQAPSLDLKSMNIASIPSIPLSYVTASMGTRVRARSPAAAVRLACLGSFGIALVFIFVRAPHPWGWEGLDHYDDYARALVRGEPFPTIDRPPGYAYFLALFYQAFGDRPWIPLLVQAALNALLPVIVYDFARSRFDDRVAIVAALLTGFFSFNTVYASTQAADSVCTILFAAAVASFARGHDRNGRQWFVLSGLCSGLAPLFRPNLLLVPLVLAGFHILARPHAPSRVNRAAVLVGVSALVIAPWTVRIYRLTGEFIPTSTHGPMQLWYGTLQTGPYLASRAYNPRTVFEAATFPYTSLDHVPLLVTARLAACAPSVPRATSLFYWTDRNPTPVRVAVRIDGRSLSAAMEPSPAPTAYYYYFDMDTGDTAAPLVYFVSTSHLDDIDRHGDLLDVFDIARMMRHIAWGDSLPFADRLDFDHDGRLADADIQAAARWLIPGGPLFQETATEPAIESTPAVATLRFIDRSSLAVPRVWSGRITDLDVRGPMAEQLLHTTKPFWSLRTARTRSGTEATCAGLEAISVNHVYYRDEPHAMRRYMALALDNIRREPAAYVLSVAYRALRVFIVLGNDDPRTTQQFAGSGRVYRLATWASTGALVLFMAGVWAAWRRDDAIGLPLVLIAYVPATLAFVLTNMRYSVTVQPLMFIFIATFVVTVLEKFGGRARGRRIGRRSTVETPRVAGTGTERQL